MAHQKFDLIIIGAGPAGLFLARELLKHAPMKNIAMIDNGRSISKRVCPLIDQGKCVQCKTCHVVYGSGGAGMYSDGKLSLWPAGTGLEKLLGTESEVIALNQYVLEAFVAGISNQGSTTKASEAQSSPIVLEAQNNDLTIKCYDVLHVGTEHIQDYCGKLEAELIKLGLNFFSSTSCLKVDKFGNIFTVELKTPKGTTEIFFSEQVAFATGKASGLLLRSLLAGLSVQTEFNSIELGVRVETTREAIKELSDCHLDAKVKLDLPGDVEVRSFCLCNGGYLVSCYYENFADKERICTISGFSFDNKKSNNSNFGILVRKYLPAPIDPIKVQLGIVQAINRASGKGATVVQRYGDFCRGVPTSADTLRVNSVQSTLDPITPTNLRWFLPEYVTSSIATYLTQLSRIAPGIDNEDTLLHAPVWELCTDRVAVNRGMETNISGLFVLGDASGWARGIIQAATTGVAAARYMLSL